MDQMLPSPGFSIPSIGTPFQQLEEDQTIIANNPYYAQNALGMHHPPTGLTPVGMGNSSTNNNGVGSSGLNTNVETTNATSLPSLMNTPTKGSSYQPSYAPTPQSMMQPQTPVCYRNWTFFPLFRLNIGIVIYLAGFSFFLYFVKNSKV